MKICTRVNSFIAAVLAIIFLNGCDRGGEGEIGSLSKSAAEEISQESQLEGSGVTDAARSPEVEFKIKYFIETPATWDQLFDQRATGEVFQAKNWRELNRALGNIKVFPPFVRFAALQCLVNIMENSSSEQPMSFDGENPTDFRLDTVQGRTAYALKVLLSPNIRDGGNSNVQHEENLRIARTALEETRKQIAHGGTSVSKEELQRQYDGKSLQDALLGNPGYMDRFLEDWKPIGANVNQLVDILGPPVKPISEWGLKDAENSPFKYYVYIINGPASHWFIFKIHNQTIEGIIMYSIE